MECHPPYLYNLEKQQRLPIASIWPCIGFIAFTHCLENIFCTHMDNEVVGRSLAWKNDHIV